MEYCFNIERRRRTPGESTPPPTLSLSPLTILDAAPPDQVVAAATAGFDAVGIRVAPAADERVWPMLSDTPELRGTLARLADTGIGVLDVELIMLRPELDRSAVLAVLDAGHRLGARFVLTLGYDADEARLTDHFAWVCAEAADRNLRPGLEFMKYSPVQTLAAAVRIVRAAGHPAGSVLVDALHLRRSGGTPADLVGVASELLPYGQLCDGPLDPVWPSDEDARLESRTGRLLPGDGEFGLTELVAALPAGGALSVEAPVAALAGLPPVERARRARAAADRVLSAATGGAGR
ncbi:MAG TPA: TIM barrel protein [Nakamurella sp.]